MSIINNLKEIGKTLREADKIPQYEQILDVREKLLEIQDNYIKLKDENKELKEQLELKKKLHFEKNAYWILIEGNRKDGPYCTCCWDDNGKLIRMQSYGNPAYYDCPKCKNKGVEIYPERDVHLRFSEQHFNKHI